MEVFALDSVCCYMLELSFSVFLLYHLSSTILLTGDRDEFCSHFVAVCR